jgi:DNA-binding NarL/FixJ family response regulator
VSEQSRGGRRKRAAKGPAAGARKTLRLALIDPRPLIRDALSHRLKTIRRECRVALFASATELLAEGRDGGAIDLIVCSVTPADGADGTILEMVERLCSEAPDKPIIIISGRVGPGPVAAALRGGARGYIPTTLDPPIAIAAVELVLAGGTFAPTDPFLPAGEGAAPPVRRDRAGAREDITAREAEILARLVEGKSNKTIARDLEISQGTVKVHLRRLMRKLGAANRTQLALRAVAVLAAPSA